ncbi:hypothetical protein [Streptomyces cinereospinus]|uniref:Uncharacterized protein n=1 Tax=Streptomyces cinereospinus TaxID=285561 RepID=A0ABV5N1E9_9ACTN
MRRTGDTGDSGTGSSRGRRTEPGVGGKPATARTGHRVLALTRWDSSSPTAGGSGGAGPVPRPSTSRRARAVHSGVRGRWSC